MKTIATIIAVVIVAIALVVLPARPIAAATEVRITAVSAFDVGQNGWTITLTTGATLLVENRALEIGGMSPAIGQVANFSDQGWLPLLGYYGYATFTQHGKTYYAHR